jgi:hypothetical protein
MKAYRLDSMLQTAIAYDRETDKIQPGLISPPPVLGSASELGPHEFVRERDMHERCRWCRLEPSEIVNTTCVHGVLLDNEQALSLFQQILDNPQVVVCVANGAYDFLVDAVELSHRGIDIMPKIFAMYDPNNEVVRGDCDGRVFEIQLAEGLHAIAQGHLGKHALDNQPLVNKATGRPGRYSLDAVTFEVQGREDAKANDRFRLSYGMFRGKPLSELPYEARVYPVDDTNNTLTNALAQAGHMPSVNHHDWQGFNGRLVCRHCQMPMTPDAPRACMRKQRRRNLHGLSLQAYFAWASHCGSAWGLNVPQDEVDKLEARVDAAAAASIGPFVDCRHHPRDGTEDQSVLKRLVAVAYGARDICPVVSTARARCRARRRRRRTRRSTAPLRRRRLRLPPEVPRSDGGGVGKSRDVLSESGDELLMEYSEQPSKKIKTTYIPLLRRGRACNVCGSTGVKTKYKKAHEDWCTAQNGEAGYRPIPLIVRDRPVEGNAARRDRGRLALDAPPRRCA